MRCYRCDGCLVDCDESPKYPTGAQWIGPSGRAASVVVSIDDTRDLCGKCFAAALDHLAALVRQGGKE